MNSYYENYPATAQSWGRMVETGTHLLRLMSGCVFDRYRDLKIIVGHMGELIPFGLERINRGLTMGSWLLAAESKKAGSAQQWAMQKSVRYYMRQNVVITTSGVFDQAALSCAIEELGIDNILFSHTIRSETILRRSISSRMLNCPLKTQISWRTEMRSASSTSPRT
jgi:predicted TIM-barrel fold metal-dependent hydrolase